MWRGHSCPRFFRKEVFAQIRRTHTCLSSSAKDVCSWPGDGDPSFAQDDGRIPWPARTIFLSPIRLHFQMDEALRKQWPTVDQDQRISEAVSREQSRLRNFIRRRVADPGDAEDILQEVFYELVEAYRVMKPVEQVTAWMFRVARNRIIDLFRKQGREALHTQATPVSEEGETLLLEDLLPSPDKGPEAAYARTVLLEQLDDALEELPAEQREIFLAHELMGYSFKELSAQTGVNVNTLLSRKHLAVRHLRERLRAIYDEFLER